MEREKTVMKKCQGVPSREREISASGVSELRDPVSGKRRGMQEVRGWQ